MATRRKNYVPATLRTFSLLGFALLCLAFIIGLDVMIHVGHGHIIDSDTQGIISKLDAPGGVLHQKLTVTIGENPTHRIRRQDIGSSAAVTELPPPIGSTSIINIPGPNQDSSSIEPPPPLTQPTTVFTSLVNPPGPSSDTTTTLEPPSPISSTLARVKRSLGREAKTALGSTTTHGLPEAEAQLSPPPVPVTRTTSATMRDTESWTTVEATAYQKVYDTLSVTRSPKYSAATSYARYPTSTPETHGEDRGTSVPRYRRRLLYFVGQYLFTLIAVLLAMLWRIIDTDFKRMQPYYELSCARGLSHSFSLCEDYLFHNALMVPLVAAHRRQWVVCISGVIAGPSFTVVQLLASAVLTLTMEQHSACDTAAVTEYCGKSHLATRDVVARALQGVLGLTVALIICLVFLQWRRKSLLYSEPWSIAGLACLVADWDSLPEVFGAIEASDSSKTLRKKIVGWDSIYRLVESNSPHPHLSIEATPGEAGKVWAPDSGSSAEKITRRLPVHRPLVLKGFVFPSGIFLSCIVTMVLVYRWFHFSDYDKFLGCQSVWARIFMLCAGIVIRSLWEPIEKEVQHLEVFRKLSRRHQSPADTILVDYTRNIPLVGTLEALFRGDFYMAYMGFVGVLIEALVVALPGVPFEASQTDESFKVSTWLSVATLTLVLFAAILMFFTRRSACMPRLPYNIATVVAYLYAARMLGDFVGLSLLCRKERNKRITALGKTYGFGWTTREDGSARVGIDKEELDFPYKYWS